jgi:hypothetical protein
MLSTVDLRLPETRREDDARRVLEGKRENTISRTMQQTGVCTQASTCIRHLHVYMHTYICTWAWDIWQALMASEMVPIWFTCRQHADSGKSNHIIAPSIEETIRTPTQSLGATQTVRTSGLLDHTLRRRAEQAFFSMAISMRFGFVTSKSSPTTCGRSSKLGEMILAKNEVAWASSGVVCCATEHT